jgi:putative ABC transport system permease protein
MRTRVLLKRNLAYFRRTNLAVVFGVAAAVAVLVGALLVGDSVRASLRDLLLSRLGRTDHVVSAQGFFRDRLASEIQEHEKFAAGGFDAVCPLVMLDGALTHEESGRRGASVQVYGVDERFWKFHGRETRAPQNREALLSESLSRELGAKAGDTILLRVEKPSAIPAESLHGRKDDLGRTVRLSVRETLTADALGEFSVRPQQTGVRALFLPLRLLQKELEQSDKVNALLVSTLDGRSPSLTETNTALLRKILKDKISLEDLGLRLRALEERGQIALESDSALVNDPLAESARATAARLNLQTSPIISYLANTIRAGTREIPYSIVAAIDEESFERLKRAEAEGSANSEAKGSAAGSGVAAGSQAGNAPTSQRAPIILNEWAARDLEARPGDTVSLEYYLWQDGGRLLTRTAEFELAGIVPIMGAAADRNLVPEYPGITGTESLSDWNPPFPVELSRIRARDEEYWDQHRTTPKAFITLGKGQELWQSRFGKLTSIRLAPAAASELRTALDVYGRSLREAVDPEQMGFAVYPARTQGLQSARGATDFGEYFLYFSFFLVASALLLAALFFKLGVEQRLREIGILQAAGFTAARVRTLFLLEGVLLAGVGTLIGLAGALAYAGLMMKGLRTWWVGAVGTTMLSLHVNASSLALGSAGGLVASALCIVWTLRRLSRVSTRSLLAGTMGPGVEQPHADLIIRTRRGRTLSFSSFRRLLDASRAALLFALLGLALLLAAAMGRIGQAAGFFGGGTSLLLALLCLLSYRLRKRSRRLIRGRGWWSMYRLGVRNATHRPGRSVLCIALVAAAAFIIVSVDAFRRDGLQDVSDKKSGSGGYSLLAESMLPLVHDPNTQEGREALNLWTNRETAALEDVSFERFRVRPGDDASCLNLYQPRNPRVLAPTDDLLRGGRFTFQSSLAQTAEEKNNPWLLLNKDAADGAIPVIADANSLTYVLHLKVGDLFVLDQGSAGIRLRVVGALSDSIFQSEFLMSEKNFLRLFPEQEGRRFFLMETGAATNSNELAAVLEERLSDYGFDVVSTGERLADFHRVENTFISTFQMLGGLGLVLGTLGLGAVLLRNVLERRRELALLRAVGYNSTHFSVMVIAENAFLLFCGLLTGTACALVSITPVIFSRGGQAPTVTLGLLLLAVLVSGLAASLVATAVALRSPLLSALRAE